MIISNSQEIRSHKEKDYSLEKPGKLGEHRWDIYHAKRPQIYPIPYCGKSNGPWSY